jgi:signal transduction histidine kinase
MIVLLLASRASEATIFNQALVDLSQGSAGRLETTALDGAWEMYWGRLLTPEDFKTDSALAVDYLQSPSVKWSDKGDGKQGTYGVATYRLRINHGAALHNMALYLPSLRTSYKLWIDGVLRIENGTPAATTADEIPASNHRVVSFYPLDDQIELVLQVANMRHGEGGGGGRILLGYSEQLGWDILAYHARDIFLAGALTIICAAFVLFWNMLREQKASIWFALFCISGAIRAISLEESGLIHEMLPQLSWETVRRIEYLTMTCGTFFITAIFFNLFTKEALKWGFYCSWIGSAIYSLVVLSAPARFFMGILPLFHLVIIFTLIISIHCLYQAVRRKRWGARLLSGALFFVAMAVFNDTANALGMINTFHIMPLSIFIMILFQSLVIGQRYINTLRRLEEAQSAVSRLNQTLEKQVMERTETIQTIINNVKFGFLMIQRDGKVCDGFTRSCRDIFKKEITVGDNIMDLLELKDRDRDHFESAIMQIFDDVLPVQATLANLQTSFNLGKRMIRLQGAVIRSAVQGDAAGQVQGVLFSVSDDTDFLHAENEADANKTLLNILRYRDAFRLYLHEAREDLERMQVLLKQGCIAELKKILHTIKGSSASFGLKEVSHYIHMLEEEQNFTDQRLNHIEVLIKRFLAGISAVADFDFEKTEEVFYEISSSELQLLQVKAQETDQVSKIRHQLEWWFHKVRSKPVGILVGPMERVVDHLCNAQHKKARLRISGGELLVDPDYYGDVIRNLIHLVRNAVAHGIEPSHSRENKPEEGTITIDFREFDNTLVILVSDDGGGIDPQQILRRAQEVKLVSPLMSEGLTAEQILQFIFHQGISTVRAADEIAGRGVGLAALHDAVTRLSGTIFVKSQLGQGCTFEIILPKPDALVQAGKSFMPRGAS